ncbi:MAG: hypothetical protein KDC45_14550 [Bacteroidetes bacterium]|nr:hypothetical protein [Bacteroidota bacterium]
MKVNRADVAGASLAPGFHRAQATLDNGSRMLYAYWIPPMQPGQKVPLILALHYAGLETDYRGEIYMRQLVEPALGDAGGIIVAPDVINHSWLDATSETAVMSLIRTIKEEWPVQPDTTIVTGYSLGGIGTWFLADKYANEFYMAIPMASEPIGFLTGKVRHYIIQGEYDELFGTANVKEAARILKSNHGIVELVIAPQLLHTEANRYVPYLHQTIPWFTDTTSALPDSN